MAESNSLYKKIRKPVDTASDALINVGNHPYVKAVADALFQKGKPQTPYTTSELEGKPKKKPGESLKKKAMNDDE